MFPAQSAGIRSCVIRSGDGHGTGWEQHGCLTDMGHMPEQSWFEDEVGKTEGDLRAFLAGLGAGSHLEEVVQDTYVVLWQQGPRADGRTLPWLKGVAKHKLVDVLRARSASSRRIELVEMLSADPASDEEDDQRESVALQRCLELLPTQFRKLVDAFYRDAQTSEVIAKLLGISAVAVRKQLMRVRRILATCIRQRLTTPS